MIRKPAVAGMFYPDNPETLTTEVKGFIEAANPTKKQLNLKGVIVPHAGYIYSGPIAGTAYRLLQEQVHPEKYQNVFILAPSHHAYIEASVGNYESYETPLGQAKVNKEICNQLEKNIPFIPEAHEREHSLEVQLPFLIESLKDFQIVPILLGEPSLDKMAELLDPYFNDENNLFIVSSDLSHYLPYEQANRTDKKTLEIITSLNIAQEREIDACGQAGIKIMMRLAKNSGYKIDLLDYRNSGDTAGDKTGVVGYGALAIYKE